jgi:hypothetical protein
MNGYRHRAYNHQSSGCQNAAGCSLERENLAKRPLNCSMRSAASVAFAGDGVLEWCRAVPAPFRDGGLSAARHWGRFLSLQLAALVLPRLKRTSLKNAPRTAFDLTRTCRHVRFSAACGGGSRNLSLGLDIGQCPAKTDRRALI